ncbi:hypothetical protein [Macrococcus brunensis]|uniref:hypothetical protein n=1 Tax=Macrococcus brunensis TaxID=198483 RepID=UPI001EF03535|nr:hypothetical protein [Macrococcus brunensis]ULG71496.1 hypothetical protein MGG12_09195 [Macrococcus brunensis]
MKTKDCIYIGIIILLLFGCLFVWKWDNEENLTNQISLITSWISISLAFLAIIYAFYQTWNTQDQNEKLTKNIESLKNESQKIINIKDLVVDMQEVIKDVNTNTNKISEIIKNIDTKTDELPEILRETLKEVSFPLDEIKSILPEATESQIVELYERINTYNRDVVSSFEENSNGYQKVKNFVRNLPKEKIFTPKEIADYFKSSNISLTNGQLAGALYRLKEEEEIVSLSRGEYKKN